MVIVCAGAYWLVRTPPPPTEAMLPTVSTTTPAPDGSPVSEPVRPGVVARIRRPTRWVRSPIGDRRARGRRRGDARGVRTDGGLACARVRSLPPAARSRCRPERPESRGAAQRWESDLCPAGRRGGAAQHDGHRRADGRRRAGSRRSSTSTRRLRRHSRSCQVSARRPPRRSWRSVTATDHFSASTISIGCRESDRRRSRHSVSW